MSLRTKIVNSLFFGYIFARLSSYISTGNFFFKDNYSLIGLTLLWFVYSVTFFFMFFADQQKPYSLRMLAKSWLVGLGLTIMGGIVIILSQPSPITLNAKQVVIFVPGLLWFWVLASGITYDYLERNDKTNTGSG